MSESLTLLVPIIIFSMLVDGIKPLFEFYWRKASTLQNSISQKRFLPPPKQANTKHSDLNLENITVVIVAYNEAEESVRTLRSVKRVFKKIIIADDGSSDRTAEIAKAAEPDIKVLKLSHRGKVFAQIEALKEVDTPYVLLIDGDIELDNKFKCPKPKALNHTALAFNIVPKSDYKEKKLIKNLLIDLQKKEYAKAMKAREWLGEKGNVLSISGACGLFKTKRLKRLNKKHTKIFQGDDLERTLQELLNKGSVRFEKSKVFTEVPEGFKKLIKQRLFSWSPGLWRNLPLIIKLFFRRDISLRLRSEIIYQLFSALSIIVKLSSLLVLLIYRNFLALLALYVIYLLIDLLIEHKIHQETEIKNKILAFLLYPIYSFFQMLLWMGGFIVYISKKELRRSGGP
jgi:cellulose synthase/poly-beta-1,6-N-acetylglucosamine synthase-like glycosyltransferase